MNSMPSAELAEFLDFKLVGLGLFVAFRHIVPVLAFSATEKNNVSHVICTFAIFSENRM